MSSGLLQDDEEPLLPPPISEEANFLIQNKVLEFEVINTNEVF